MTQKFIPILFSTEMVQAILDGRKTQTRRITVDWDQNKPTYVISSQGMYGAAYPKPAKYMAHFRCPESSTDTVGLVAPVQPGDILWVRETWQVLDTQEDDVFDNWDDDVSLIYKVCYTYKASNDLRPNGISAEDWCGNWQEVNEDHFLRANERIETEEVEGRDVWYPSIHMPKNAARIFLKVTSVKCERLNDITQIDAKKEGIKIDDCGSGKNYLAFGWTDAKSSFETLWTKIHGKGSWEVNPFVWVYEFDRIDKPENFL